ncbi:DEAD/DEAH box helicase [Mucilaginibacter myungsuensis]|uniref:DEAD/DEAH box helicase n=1 Tax=Mucilaginibacter myungsuensis TaxID=649104 RepID=A0A929KX68_9SPHI|nr:DEAD/DEAH box helicase [Mucilaginibacter myungsuensis]MBE9660315.1 DEAD/DEAH box helicase [Mucilaginibacter myungsuensis]MDN3600357.1 DEAD/DEAH box helicase [Mucilaginibacter myungsuensis]
MGWLEKIKLTKQLLRSAAEAGYASPTEMQLKTMSRMIGGNDLVAVGPQGSGKTTAYVLSVLNRFNYAPDGVPQVLILVPNQDAVEAVIDRFDTLNRNRSISIVGLYAAPGIEGQMDALADGADIVVATPDRARAIYLKLGLNLNKLQVIIVDDADLIVKQGLQLPVAELANSVPKAQRILFTEVMHEKLEKMIGNVMVDATPVIEVDEIGEPTLSLLPQMLYQVPNFGTKINLLNLFMQDEELFTKVIVFVNTKQTAMKIYDELSKINRGSIALLNSWNPTLTSIDDVATFKDSDTRMLIVANENNDEVTLDGVPFILHFDLPEEKDIYLGRVVNSSGSNEDDETITITLATDIELTLVKRIEQAGGQKMQVMELPDDLVIAKEKKKKEEAPKASTKEDTNAPGAAFHEKKAKNSKNYNYSSGEKAKMNMKKKHG